MLSLSFVISAYWLCGQWRRKKPEILWNKGHLCVILKLIQCGTICGKVTAVTDFSMWRLKEITFKRWQLTNNYFPCGIILPLNFHRHLLAMATLLDEGNTKRKALLMISTIRNPNAHFLSETAVKWPLSFFPNINLI